MTETQAKRDWVPPLWVERIFWTVHRTVYRLTRGRLGLWRAKPDRWGTLRLKTVGRRSGKRRIAILGYYEDGPNVVTLAMNGWNDGEPGWWLNLQANPDVTIELVDGPRAVRAYAAQGEERTRLWQLFKDAEKYAPLRSTETAVVVLAPRPDAA